MLAHHCLFFMPARLACDKQKKHSNRVLLPIDAQQQRRQQPEPIPIRLFKSYIALDLALLTTAVRHTERSARAHHRARTFLPIRLNAPTTTTSTRLYQLNTNHPLPPTSQLRSRLQTPATRSRNPTYLISIDTHLDLAIQDARRKRYARGSAARVIDLCGS